MIVREDRTMVFKEKDETRATAIMDVETGKWSIYINPYAVTTADEYLQVREEILLDIERRKGACNSAH